jgi:hypothetical protein
MGFSISHIVFDPQLEQDCNDKEGKYPFLEQYCVHLRAAVVGNNLPVAYQLLLRFFSGYGIMPAIVSRKVTNIRILSRRE